jgi:hypothetical protein
MYTSLMLLRVAPPGHVDAMSKIRMAVHENVLASIRSGRDEYIDAITKNVGPSVL